MRKIWKEKWFWKDLAIMFGLWVLASSASLFQMHQVGLSVDASLIERTLLSYLKVVAVIAAVVIAIDSRKSR